MLRFADEAHPHHVDLPVDVATEKVAVVGVSGSGKTTLAAVLVEEVHEAGGRVVVLDTQGEWWSLRAGRDGQEGLPFVIFGGEKADVPIDAGMGKKLGTVLVESSVSAVVDASRIPARARGAFFTALLTELYEGNRRPLFLVVDEADLFAPQKPSRAGAQELLDVMVDVVRRGRKFGFGAMLITQRPAAVAKEVLSQAETLFVTRLAGEHDQGAIDRWLGTHVPRTEREAVLATLATLPTGEVWGVSP
ncbi:MAG: ATP-binding protein, partial [Rhodocyclaceae bacterium]